MNEDAMMTEPDLNAGISKANALRWWVFFVVSIIGVFLSGCYWMVNGDIWWHLKAGELIRATGTVPDVNQFTFTNPDTPGSICIGYSKLAYRGFMIRLGRPDWSWLNPV